MKCDDLARLDLHTVTRCKNRVLLALDTSPQYVSPLIRNGVLNEFALLTARIMEIKDNVPLGKYASKVKLRPE